MGAKGVGDALGSFISGPDINELKKRIESELESAKRRVLILIDDVDRLEKTEIHALFRLVKLTADFKYTSYILAFDKDVVAASLQDRYSSAAENSGEAFLEKIIQVPLHLPAVEKQVLREFCFQGVDEAISIAGITLSQQQVQEFVRNFSSAFDDCLTTPRKAKLYGNILMFSLPILQGEVNPVDLMLLEGIRVFCPSLYEVLRINKALFSGTFIESHHSNNDSEKEQIKILVERALSCGKNINKAGFIDLLQNMFPKLNSVYGNMSYGTDWYKSWDNGQRICSENYYSRYFTYSIPKGDLSDKTIQELTYDSEKWDKTFDLEKNPLNNILNTESAEILIKKMRDKVSELNADTSSAIAVAIAQKSNDIPNPEVLFSWMTPFSQAAMLVSDLIQNIQKTERINLVKTCINSASTLEFKLEIFKWLKREDKNKPEKDAFPEIYIDEIGKHLGKVIVKKLEEDQDIFKLESRLIPTIFYTVNKYVRSDYVNDYVLNLISSNSEAIIRILESYVPTVWGVESGVSHKSDFEREQYNNLTRELETSIILNAIQKHYPQAVDVSDDFPRMNDNIEDEKLLFLKQFVWLHHNVLNKSQSKEKSHDKE